MGFITRIFSFIFWVGVLVAVFARDQTAGVIAELFTIVGVVFTAMVSGVIGLLGIGA